jgi:hypothetical protein
VTVPRLGSVAETDQNDILAMHERSVSGESSQRSLTATDGKGEAHAGGRAGARFFGLSEVSVRVEIGKTHRPSGGLSRTQEASKHNAAIATEHDCKAAIAGCGRYPFAERPAIGNDFSFVPHPSRRTNIVSIRERDDITKIAGTQAFYQAKLAEDTGSAVKLPAFTAVVRTDADARRCAHDCDATMHGLKSCPYQQNTFK